LFYKDDVKVVQYDYNLKKLNFLINDNMA